MFAWKEEEEERAQPLIYFLPPLPFSLNVMYGHPPPPPPPPPLSFSPVPDKEERDKNQPIIKFYHTSIGQKLEKKYLFFGGGNEYLVISVPKAKPRAPLMSILLLLLLLLVVLQQKPILYPLPPSFFSPLRPL